MDPLIYCEQKAAAAGSPTYYAIRRGSSVQRGALTALYAFEREMFDTVMGVGEPSVAEAKLDWWLGQIKEAERQPAVHPVLQALQSTGVLSATTAEPLLALAEAYRQDLHQSRYLDYPGLLRYIDSTAAAFASLVAGVCGQPVGASNATLPPQPIAMDAAWSREIGRGLALIRIVADMGGDARHGRIYVPVSDMQQFGVTAASILNRHYDDAFVAMMRFEAARARETLLSGCKTIPPRERRAQRPLRAQCAMAIRLLDEIERSEYTVLHQRIALTPLRNVWAAWRLR